VGIEDPDDLIADLGQALDESKRTALLEYDDVVELLAKLLPKFDGLVKNGIEASRKWLERMVIVLRPVLPEPSQAFSTTATLVRP
jgi:hypothetical protein